MRFVTELADAHVNAIRRKVGRTHLDQIRDALSRCATKESHTPQVSWCLLHDVGVTLLRPWAVATIFDLEFLDADSWIVATISTRHTELEQRAQDCQHEIGCYWRAAHSV